jgi:hypothetical protein
MGEKYQKIIFKKNIIWAANNSGFFFYKGICDVAAKVAIIQKTI